MLIGFSMELTITNIVIFSPHSFSSLLNFNKLSIVKSPSQGQQMWTQ